jgi:hypothetical protein
MTSWISSTLPKKKVAPAPASFFSYGEGTFVKKTQEVTVVTALYEVTKEKVEALSKIQNLLVIFTDSKLADALVSARQEYEDRTRVIVLEKDQWVSTRKYIPNLWAQQVKQDTEIQLGRTAEDLHFLFEKKEFMVKAGQINPFGTIDFVWVDPSFLQPNSGVDINFARADRIPTDRLVVWNPEPFTSDDIASSYFRGKRRVDNGILAGSKQAWIEYAKLYEVVMALRLKTEQFIGDDLFMLHYCVIHKPNQFCLIKDKSFLSYFSEE